MAEINHKSYFESKAIVEKYVLFLFQNYTPTSFDKSFGYQEVNKHDVHFSFWDTSGKCCIVLMNA